MGGGLSRPVGASGGRSKNTTDRDRPKGSGNNRRKKQKKITARRLQNNNHHRGGCRILSKRKSVKAILKVVLLRCMKIIEIDGPREKSVKTKTITLKKLFFLREPKHICVQRKVLFMVSLKGKSTSNIYLKIKSYPMKP